LFPVWNYYGHYCCEHASVYLLEYVYTFLLGIYFYKSGIARQVWLWVCSASVTLCQVIFQSAKPIYSPSSSVWELWLLYIFTNNWYFLFFFMLAFLVGV
jgi:hypothetical protein